MNLLQHMLRFIGFSMDVTGDTLALSHRQAHGFNDASHSVSGSRSALKARITALVQKNQLIEATSTAKTRLFAAAIHDLRQPLQALMLFSDALSEDEVDPTRLQRIDRIRQSVDSLDRLFTGLLDLTQIDAGRMLPECRDLALDPLLDEVRLSFQAVAEAQGLRLVVRHTDAQVHGDGMMLTRILNNLVCNALRHTHGGGVIVGTRRHQGGTRIDVCDTGIGIAPQHQSRVFDEFYRVAPSGPAAHGDGLGLGLATVQRLADLQGATVRLRSRPGRGTVVSVLLPAAHAAKARSSRSVPGFAGPTVP
jgi:signal transduction histidine kinase